MPIRSRTLKVSAKQAMRAAVPPAILLTLTYLLLTDVLSNVLSIFLPAVSPEDLIYDHSFGTWMALFLTVLLFLYKAVMGYGYNAWSLCTARRQHTGYGSLLDGFGMPGRVLGMNALIWLRIFLWAAVCMMVYSTFFLPILLTIGINMYNSLELQRYLLLSFVLVYLAVLLIALRYSLAPYLLHDYPDAGCNTAVRRSAEMTRGRIWALVKLHLSFWPWYLLQFLIAVGVLMTVIAPILQTALQAETINLDLLQVQLIQSVTSKKTSALILLLLFPVDLFFRPYLNIALANFYRTLSGELLEHEPSSPDF